MLGMFTQPQGGHGCCADSMTSAPRIIAANPAGVIFKGHLLPAFMHLLLQGPPLQQPATYLLAHQQRLAHIHVNIKTGDPWMLC